MGIAVTEITTILVSAIVALSGALVWIVKIVLNQMRENTRVLDRALDVMIKLEEWLKNWRAR